MSVLLESLLSGYLNNQQLNQSGELIKFSRFIEVDCSSGNIVLTLGGTTSFPKYQSMTIKRIDDSLNTLTINGTGGNYEDDGIILFGLEGTTIYASDANIWRSVL